MKEEDAIKKFPIRRYFIKNIYKQGYEILSPEDAEKLKGMYILAHVHGMNPFDKKED